MENVVYKDTKLEISVKAVNPEVFITGATYYSYDVESGRFLIHLKKDQVDFSIPEGTDLKMTLIKLSDNTKYIVVPEIENRVKGVISLVIPKILLGYVGGVRAGIFIKPPNTQSVHGGYFTFNMALSDIDDDNEEMVEYYNQLFEDLVINFEKDVNELMTDAEQHAEGKIIEYDKKFVEVEEKVSSMENQASNMEVKQDEILKKIEENDVPTKAESSANVIDTIGGATSTIFKDEMLVNGVEAAASRNNGTLEPFSQADYDDLDNPDKYVRSETLLNGRGAAIDCEFPVIEILEKRHPWMFENSATLDEKIEIYLSYNPTFRIPFSARGRGILTSNNVESSRSMMHQKRKNGTWIGVASGTTTNITSNFVTYGNEGWGKTHFDEVLTDGSYTFRVCSKNNDLSVSGSISDGLTPAWVELRDIKLIVEFEANGRTVVESIVAADRGENLGNVDNYKTANQTEAESGTATDKFMTPLRTKQFYDQQAIERPKFLYNTTNFCAHRGNNADFPENSSEALKSVTRHRYTEFDVNITKDGKWVVMHDDTVDRMTNGTGRVDSFTYDQIRALRIDTGANIGILRDWEKVIPSMDEAIKYCKMAGSVPFIEIKTNNYTDSHLQEFMNVLKQHKILNGGCVVISFDKTILERLRIMSNEIELSWVMNSVTQTELNECIRLRMSADVAYSHATVTKDIVKSFHDKGLQFCVWTAPDEAFSDLIEKGVDVITTNSRSGDLRWGLVTYDN
ncbi:glycerophosphodiester phosphodiesterase family protein, partial [Enterococcus avium]|uniref:glycerophosphodiester phosphodiesterase family protein n=1 Tax=Enterococcus avium TaxID=33945 RepID=UPI00289219C3